MSDKDIKTILEKEELNKADLVFLLNLREEKSQDLFDKALDIKLRNVGNTIHLRGLIEYSNLCEKNCLYCGLRKKNEKKNIYTLTDKQIDNCISEAIRLRYGSVALQCGEQSSKEFTSKITSIIKRIKELSLGKIGITLSCGEQKEEVYKEWFQAGAHRYLLRIESSNKELYYKIHPNDEKHSFKKRVACIDNLKEIGYQVGTGIMVGLPFQTLEDLAEDILFFKQKDVAMVGLGPFIPHQDTPLWKYKDQIHSDKERMLLTLKTLALVRIVMPKINMVSATANQTLDPLGREKAIMCGANVVMPNLTPTINRKDYAIYPNKACVQDTPNQCASCLERRIKSINHTILYDQWGDSPAFLEKNK
ncbi:MAG: [FeFe] hydrogenase H-cluster radical SAM maturase HydE [Bacteroidota bacterium]|nr:[FeFe] hydrogenase H-cluster radical SAM maturase HydE [Bacteroidota bacterium]